MSVEREQFESSAEDHDEAKRLWRELLGEGNLQSEADDFGIEHARGGVVAAEAATRSRAEAKQKILELSDLVESLPQGFEDRVALQRIVSAASRLLDSDEIGERPGRVRWALDRLAEAANLLGRHKEV